MGGVDQTNLNTSKEVTYHTAQALRVVNYSTITQNSENPMSAVIISQAHTRFRLCNVEEIITTAHASARKSDCGVQPFFECHFSALGLLLASIHCMLIIIISERRISGGEITPHVGTFGAE